MWGDDGKKRPKKQNGRQLNGKIFDEMPYQLPLYG
jgi:protein gp37